MRPRTVSFALVALGALAVFAFAACGRSSTSEDASAGADASSDATIDPMGGPADGGATDDASPDAIDDAADSGSSGPCPASLPEAGTPCAISDLWCEYGGDARGLCSTRASCAPQPHSKDLAWDVLPADPECSIAGACPPSFDLDGGACPPDAGTCEYAEGRCACLSCTDDAGLVSGSQWTCRAWSDVVAQMTGDGGPADASACDVARPRLGASCDAGAIVCGYDSCVGVSLGYYQTCSGGLWAMGPATDLCNLDRCR